MNDDTTDIGTLALADDRGIGLAMILTFEVAILVVTAAVAMLAPIDTWWVLGLAFGIHLVVTAAVGLAVFDAVGGGTRTFAGSARQPAARHGEVLEHSARMLVQARSGYPVAA